MRARIYQPSKTAMQSGKNKTKAWLLEYAPNSAKKVDPLMGYNSSSDMQQQIKLKFEDQESAIAYADKHNLAYDLIETKKVKRQPASYPANFAHNRKGTWTH